MLLGWVDIEIRAIAYELRGSAEAGRSADRVWAIAYTPGADPRRSQRLRFARLGFARTLGSMLDRSSACSSSLARISSSIRLVVGSRGPM